VLPFSTDTSSMPPQPWAEVSTTQPLTWKVEPSGMLAPSLGRSTKPWY
jgi:hypothetical protein